VYQPPKLRRRADEPIWSREVYRVAKIEGAHVVGDDGRRHLTKEVLPVSAESRPAPPAPLRERPRQLLQRYAERAVELVRGGPVSSQRVAQELSKLGDLRAALRLAGAATRQPINSLVRLFPDLLRLRDRTVSAAPSGPAP
jgi:hypothetical protein